MIGLLGLPLGNCWMQGVDPLHSPLQKNMTIFQKQVDSAQASDLSDDRRCRQRPTPYSLALVYTTDKGRYQLLIPRVGGTLRT